MDAQDIDALNESLQQASPREILATLLPVLGRTALSFSGAEDVVLVDQSEKLRKIASEKEQSATIDLHPFTLDTGRLHPATHRYLERVRKHYSLTLDALMPDPDEVNELVRSKGLFSFYADGHKECCEIRKVTPLRAHLAGFNAWITGQRRDQSPTRSEVPIIEFDKAFSTPRRRLIKVNPLANTSSMEVWQLIRSLEIPYNELHDQGFASIGCEPCSRPVGPGQHEREGRWWWEEATQKECGLHIPIKQL